MKLILSIAIDAKHSNIGLINAYGDIQAQFTINHDKEDLLINLNKEVLENLKTLSINYETEIEKVAIALNGYVDNTSGIVGYSMFLDWNGFELKKIAEELFNKPVFILNGVNARALGEFWTGAAKPYDSIVFYFIDLWIGGSIVLEGKLIPGARGYAGEFGHGGGAFNQTKQICRCGLVGCIGPISSVIGIEKYFTDTFAENPNHNVADYFINIKVITLKSILEIYELNEKPLEIKNLLEEALKPLIMHMATMFNALDPEAFIIEGGLTTLDKLLLEIINENIKKYIIEGFTEGLTVEFAKLGNDSIIIGAAYYALNDWKMF